MICFPIVQAMRWTRRSLQDRKARRRLEQEAQQQQVGNHRGAATRQKQKMLTKKKKSRPAELSNDGRTAVVEAPTTKDPVKTDGRERPVEADFANVKVEVEGENVQGSGSRRRRTIESYYDGLTTLKLDSAGLVRAEGEEEEAEVVRDSIAQTPTRYCQPLGDISALQSELSARKG